MTAAVPVAPTPRGLARSTATMTALTAVSRGTGFLRIVVVTNVLGTTYLANTYQTANTVPNILFELLAAGALQAVMIPAMVDLVDAGDRDETEHVVGAVLGLTCTALAAITAAAMVAAPWVMRIMVSDVSDAQVRAAEVRLGTFLLMFFLPQVVLYAANVVATAVLNATGSFALPVFAPTVNNVVVIGTYLLFAAMTRGTTPTLDLDVDERLVLAVGTTLGVVAFCAVTILAARRRVRLRPNLDHRHPAVRRLARQGAWAAAFLALSQVLLVVMLQISNRVPGGVAVYQLAWVLYLLPHSLFSVPVMTTRFPTMSRQITAEDWSGFADSLTRGVRSISFLTLPATTLLIALATPITRLIVHGSAARRLPEIADAVAGFAPGILGFGLLLFFTRGCYARRDARTPTIANLGVAIVGTITMFVAADQVAGRYLVASLGVCSAIANTLGAVALGVVLHRLIREHGAHGAGALAALARNLVAAGLAGVAAWYAADAIGGTDIVAAILQVVAGSIVGAALFVGAQFVFGGPAPVLAVSSLGAASRRDAAPLEPPDGAGPPELERVG